MPNLLADLPANLPNELFETLVSSKSIRIQRIISHGHASPPDFWYDLADEYGLLFQNEWLYWQHHGWDDQIRKEYTDWVWADGSHPSIAIWDALNENQHPYIGNVLIPELKKLDPTRVWEEFAPPRPADRPVEAL